MRLKYHINKPDDSWLTDMNPGLFYRLEEWGNALVVVTYTEDVVKIQRDKLKMIAIASPEQILKEE
jgi:hypothetical protein